jgi:iron complex outermembrane recepter protein
MRARGDQTFKFFLAGGVATSLLAAFTGGAWAQSAPAAGATASDEIIVTANKREERLLDVPMAVSAISGEELQATQTLDLQDLQVRVPGLRLFSGGGTQNRIVIRGQNAGGDGATVVSLMDEVPLGFSAANNGGGFVVTDFDTYDLQRVEVLRGPQGTLYGATAEAGLIKYVTNAPDPSAFAAGFEGGVYTLDHGGSGEAIKGYVNAPLGDKAAFRVSGYYEELPGFIDDSFRGLKDVNEGERYGVRASLLVRPTDDLSIRLLAFHQQKEAGGFDAVAINGVGPNPLGLVNGYDLPSYVDRDYTSLYNVFYADIAYDLGFAELHSISSFGEADNQFNDDVSFFAPTMSFFAGEPAAVRRVQTIAVQKFTQELRLASPGMADALFDWQVGLFYTKEEIDYVNDAIGVTYPGDQFISIPDPFFGAVPLGQLSVGRIPSQYEALAGYADTTIHFTPNFDLQLGVRAEQNEQSSQTTIGGLLALLSGFPAFTVQDKISTDESVFTYSIAPRLRLSDDVNVYARVAKGYRPGGPQVPLPTDPPNLPQSFDSDSTINYEVGLKGQFFDKQVSADVAVFYIDWSDIQLSEQVIVSGQAYSRTGNGGKALSRGVEWNFEYRPDVIEGLTLDLLGAFTEAYLTEDAPGVGGFKDDRLTYVPKWSVTLAANHDWELGGGYTAFVGADASHVSSRHTGYGLTDFLLPGYELYNARLGVRRDNWTVQLYGKNLGDEIGYSSFASTGIGAPSGSFGGAAILRPRTYGLLVTANF